MFASDVVDDPAANDGMFGTFFTDSVKLSAEATAVLDKVLQNESAVDFLLNFLMRYQSNRTDIKTGKPENKEEVVSMEFHELTVDVLKKERPELFEAIRKEGREAGVVEGSQEGKEDGVKEERARALGILKESKNFQDVGELAVEAIEKGSTGDQALISFQQKQLKGLQENSPEHPGPNVGTEGDPSKLSHMDRAKKYQAEHGGSMTAALQATAVPRKK